MISVTLVAIRVPTEQGLAIETIVSHEAFICPQRIDTVTVCGDHAKHQVDRSARAVIRYDDRVHGYKLYYVVQSAAEIAAARRREMRGEDSQDPMGLGGDDAH